MTTTDYLLNIGLIGLVIMQIRGRRLSPVNLLLPLVVVTWAAIAYLHSFPTSGNDLVLEIGSAAFGAVLGIGCALTSRLQRNDTGSVVVKAGVAAAALWILGVGSRLAFEIAATHGGGEAIGRFSLAHAISLAAWGPALILMAFAEVAFRSGGIYLRAWRAGHLSASSNVPAANGVTVPSDASSIR
ncbi:MAG: hypothetical protein ACLPTB_10190 [Acidimicrobiales bacterium]|jgi:hypothetical protein